ncbi:hypothetical protein [Agrococcus sp. ARC_14]|uniref:hypothetical protein n=1 Tax=Agrococcus sp. ARC_14 TaxID=2919927 RepID=UPI001F05D83A|nr:hypothetical protein [Agrococcus sp. ARC_14]MCH1881871.1 hypothetical protein [Agrococcus sp. ARC_14]
MEFADRDEPIPEIPTLDAVGAEFPVRLATLVPQPGIRETGVNTISSSVNDGPFCLEAAAITYAILWNPDDLDDPVNHVELHPDIAAAIADPSPKLPAVAVEMLQWARFPSAYEAVQTHVLDEDESVADRLALHMRNVIGNTFREQRDPTPQLPWSFIDPPVERDAVDASVVVDGVELPAVSIDDEHVTGVGVELDDAVATVVLAKHLLPLVRLELTRRPRPAEGKG